MKNHTKKTDRFQAEFHETLLWYSLLIPLADTLLTVLSTLGQSICTVECFAKATFQENT